MCAKHGKKLGGNIVYTFIFNYNNFQIGLSLSGNGGSTDSYFPTSVLGFFFKKADCEQTLLNIHKIENTGWQKEKSSNINKFQNTAYKLTTVECKVFSK